MRERLLNIARIRAAASWRVRPEKHAYHQWLIVSSGRSSVTTGGRTYEAAAGQCFFFHAGHTHEEWTDAKKPHESFGICFDSGRVHRRHPVLVDDSEGRMRVLARWLTDEWNRHSKDSTDLRNHYFHCLVSEFLRLAAGTEDPVVATVRRYIRANVARPLGLDELAACVKLSRSHFSRLYRQKAGHLVSDDLRAIRLEHAQGLLMTSDTPVKDIAALSGFADPQYMTRLFRKHLGVTPGELRRAHPDRGR